MKNYKELLGSVTTFMFDYDGVMTDGNVLLMENGDPVRMINVKDAYALQFARKLGYRVMVVSGGTSEAIRMRFMRLGIDEVNLGVQDKLEFYKNYIAEHKLGSEEIVYMGDDIPDFKIMKEVGVPVCPADASIEIKDISVYISDKTGGRGCVRDIIEQVLRLKGQWMNEQAFDW